MKPLWKRAMRMASSCIGLQATDPPPCPRATPVLANWCLSSNIGDSLNIWLTEKITGLKPIYVDIKLPYPKLLMVGSILNWGNEHCIAWGPGLLNAGDAVNPRLDIRATRGPISSERAREHGCKTPDVHGDPGLLLPRFLPAKRRSRYRVGVIPHYIDWHWLIAHPLIQSDEIAVLNVFDEVEIFMAKLVQCDLVLSSSLHGLVFAHAYGVPAVWVQMSEQVLGDGTKFRDHLRAVGVTGIDEPIPIADHHRLDEVLNAAAPAIVRDIDFNPDPLWDACPLR